MNIVPSRDAVSLKSKRNNANINENLDKLQQFFEVICEHLGEGAVSSKAGVGGHLKEDGEGGRGNVVIERVQECQAGNPALNERSSQDLFFFPPLILPDAFLYCLLLLLLLHETPQQIVASVAPASGDYLQALM